MSVYLELFHGRRNPHEDLDDWGFEGPVLGPFPFVHITYGSTIKVGINPVISSPYCNSNLHIDEDGFIVFAGSYYGDMSVFDDPSYYYDAIKLRIKITKEVFQTDPALLIGTKEDWVVQYITWRFKNDPANPRKSRPARRQAHAKPGRGRGKNL